MDECDCVSYGDDDVIFIDILVVFCEEVIVELGVFEVIYK